MAVSKLKSTNITNLDATPIIYSNAGSGASGALVEINGFAIPLAADAVLSTYQLVRVPSYAIIKHLILENEAQGAGAVQLGLYYSDSTTDGTAQANLGLVVPSGVNFFANDVNLAAAINATDYVNGIAGASAGLYNISLRNQKLWQAAGLATDPGGFFDIVATVHTTAITTGTGRLSLSAQYVIG